MKSVLGLSANNNQTIKIVINSTEFNSNILFFNIHLPIILFDLLVTQGKTL